MSSRDDQEERAHSIRRALDAHSREERRRVLSGMTSATTLLALERAVLRAEARRFETAAWEVVLDALEFHRKALESEWLVRSLLIHTLVSASTAPLAEERDDERRHA